MYSKCLVLQSFVKYSDMVAELKRRIEEKGV